MALLTDGNPNNEDSLRVYESSILSVANVEFINLDSKLGLAAEEISQDLVDVLIEHSRMFDDLTNVRRRKGVSDVVVTPQLRRWHALHTLETVYRDAYNNQLNDRYRLKWEEYQELGRDARESTLRYGIGLVLNPLPVPATPLFGVAAGLIVATTYYVQAAWVSAQGQESSPSATTTFATADGSLLTVQLANPPAGATGWNVYVGLTDAPAAPPVDVPPPLPNNAPIALQNSAPLALGSMFTLAASGVAAGRAPGDGQTPDIYITGGRMLRRG